MTTMIIVPCNTPPDLLTFILVRGSDREDDLAYRCRLLDCVSVEVLLEHHWVVILVCDGHLDDDRGWGRKERRFFSCGQIIINLN